MCANIGVDPLASNKGTWNKLLGFGGEGVGPQQWGGRCQGLQAQPSVSAAAPRPHPSPPDPPAHLHPPTDFYYELGVQVTEACLTLRPLTGGLVALDQLHRFVQVCGGCAGVSVCVGGVRWRGEWWQGLEV